MPSGVYKRGIIHRKPQTEETKKKISEKNKINYLDPIRRKQISERQRGKKNWNFGKPAWNKGKGIGRRMVKMREKEKILIQQELIAGRKKPNQCELCGREGKICYDHDHKTGRFRGWICHKCNVSLGLVDDNIQTLELMVEYIKNNQSYE